MRAVSEEFLRTVRGSHVMRSRARVCTTFQSSVNPDGTVIPILGGDVKSQAQILGTVNVTGATVTASLDLTTDDTLWPYNTADLLAPFGNEIYVERGIAFGNGVIEWVGQGYFRIDTVEQDDMPSGIIRVAARDRMAGIIDARLPAPRQYAAGTTFGAVVDELVLEVYPAAVIEWDDLTDAATIGRALIAEEDRHAFLADLITSVGKTWAFDQRGTLRIAAPPDVHDPVYEINAGAQGVLIHAGRDLSREGVYNGVVASGEAADTEPPVRAVVVDDNPNSPTYWEGPFGKVPRFYSSPFITTEAQAESAAESILQQSLGLPYNVEFGTVPNPALEPLDPVRISYPRTSRSPSLRSETHLIEEITVPLTVTQPMTARTREQTLVIAGSG